jgi:hypothetical protein
MRNWALGQISGILWCWTAAGVDAKHGVLKSDALKYNVDLNRATLDAIRIRRTGSIKDLRHEHVVPRNYIAKHIVDDDIANVAAIADLLTNFCIAVIVTKAEDRKLRPRDSMPESWEWKTGDVFARYRNSGLYEHIQFPKTPFS